MPFELQEVLRARQGENFSLQAQYMNPQMGRVLKTIGFDHYYERGEGCYLYDAEGRRYLDFLSGFGVFALGRGHPAVTRAIHEALDADLPNLVQMDCALLPGLLAEALVQRSHPGIERALFTNSGAEAIESAIKFARAATKRDRIVYCDHGFHGLTTGALSLNGGKEFRDGFGRFFPPPASPSGTSTPWPGNCGKGDVAAFVVEPIQGKGVNLAAEEYWAAAQTLCRRHKTLLRHGRGAGRDWAGRASSSATSTGGCSPTSSRSPRRCRAVTSRWGRCCRRPRSSTASSARWTAPWSTPPPSP